MITVHHLNNSRSQRILWMLEELGVLYEIKFYQRDPQTMLAPAELKRIHPLGKAPVLTDGDVTLAESGAIIEYLCQKYGKLKPQNSYWLHYAEGSLMPPLLLTLIFSKIEATPVPFFIRPVIKQIVQNVRRAFIGPQTKTHFDYVEAHLQTNEWFNGSDFTAADIMMSFPLEAAASRGVGDYPAVKKFVQKIHARPAYQKALERGGPYDYA